MEFPPHSGHDYEALSSAWQELNSSRGWKASILTDDGGQPVWAVENGIGARDSGEGFYLSAGIHGDECAPVWALLDWASSGAEVLETLPVVMFPCLNPTGLIGNIRLDHHGNDLNRSFENREIPLVRAWQDFMEGRKLRLAANLHEDYDAGGIYLYELARSGCPGETLLSACESIIPREPAENVDGYDFENGIRKRPEDLQKLIREDLDGGWPESIYLYLHHTHDAVTFETPSELDLGLRIRTHRRFIEALTER